MNKDSLLGVWIGMAGDDSGWDMKITISILQPLEIGSRLGVFNIPMLPCSGTFRVVSVHDETIELQTENLQGECREADSDALELLPDGTLQYVSKGKGWETRGILKRANSDGPIFSKEDV